MRAPSGRLDSENLSLSSTVGRRISPETKAVSYHSLDKCFVLALFIFFFFQVEVVFNRIAFVRPTLWDLLPRTGDRPNENSLSSSSASYDLLCKIILIHRPFVGRSLDLLLAPATASRTSRINEHSPIPVCH